MPHTRLLVSETTMQESFNELTSDLLPALPIRLTLGLVLDDALVTEDAHTQPFGQVFGVLAGLGLLWLLARPAHLPGTAISVVFQTMTVVVTLINKGRAVPALFTCNTNL